MNELQQVLLVFAVIVVVGLYFFSRQRNQRNKSDGSERSASRQSPSDRLKQKFAKGFSATQDQSTGESVNNAPLVKNEAMAGKTQEELDFESRQQLLKWEEPLPEVYPFEPTPTAEEQTQHQPKQYQPKPAESSPSPQHKVLEIDDLELVDKRFTGSYNSTSSATTSEKRSVSPRASSQEPQIYAILVLFTQVDMSVNKLMTHLQGVGLVYDERGIYVKKAANRTIVKVANVMEPGLFPPEPDESMKTPGIALILELPSSIPAPGAMEELIMTARRISQSLEGRMYDMQRHLLRESDIQSMREAALNYESKKLH
ncbi:cell division protein ZipA C-terminal FtsZ-binding domain-containing protein [Thiomicrospira sp. R3]|uniref:cell division protein ZipA C-terminal FtsZ-binding domain-containing protein n=1 Tax=Thiomicrospira sp. R3 TaxID=3035472 RepID=UPI00259BD3EA|nr:cell division protein ZipA C-terminal FtsZ-binding domain-containing protein [Thiomicrospira sp. R3]WFE68557.1 cell division protein ZipA C-terminal FtsZ-binding domain-containing protein [Thiomicrospira sp. R3]